MSFDPAMAMPAAGAMPYAAAAAMHADIVGGMPPPAPPVAMPMLQEYRFLSLLQATGITEDTAESLMLHVRSYGSNIIQKLQYQIESTPEHAASSAEQIAFVQRELDLLRMAQSMSVDKRNILNVLNTAIRFTDCEIAKLRSNIVMYKEEVDSRYADITNGCKRERDWDDYRHAQEDLAREDDDLTSALQFSKVLSDAFSLV